MYGSGPRHLATTTMDDQRPAGGHGPPALPSAREQCLNGHPFGASFLRFARGRLNAGTSAARTRESSVLLPGYRIAPNTRYASISM